MKWKQFSFPLKIFNSWKWMCLVYVRMSHCVFEQLHKFKEVSMCKTDEPLIVIVPMMKNSNKKIIRDTPNLQPTTILNIFNKSTQRLDLFCQKDKCIRYPLIIHQNKIEKPFYMISQSCQTLISCFFFFWVDYHW